MSEVSVDEQPKSEPEVDEQPAAADPAPVAKADPMIEQGALFALCGLCAKGAHSDIAGLVAEAWKIGTAFAISANRPK